MLKFQALRSPIEYSLEELEEQTRIPKKVLESFLERFTESSVKRDRGSGAERGKYLKSSTCKNRIVCHLVVLYLLIKGFRINATELARALKIDTDKLMPYLRECGCGRVRKEGEEEKE